MSGSPFGRYPEGFCEPCWSIVAMRKGVLIEHRGAHAAHFDAPNCPGSGKPPYKLPANTIDPWGSGLGGRPRPVEPEADDDESTDTMS